MAAVGRDEEVASWKSLQGRVQLKDGGPGREGTEAEELTEKSLLRSCCCQNKLCTMREAVWVQGTGHFKISNHCCVDPYKRVFM